MKKRLITFILAIVSVSALPQSGNQNADFESSSSGQVTGSTQVQGWVVTAESMSIGPTYNTCSLTNCCPGNPTLSAVITTTTGYLDNTIGSVYPIYSVFGSSPAYSLAASFNPGLGINMHGSTFFRLNDNVPGTLQVEQLSKTIYVTPSSNLLEIAYMFVVHPGHPCCTGPAINIFVNSSACGLIENFGCQAGIYQGIYEAGTGLPYDPNSFFALFTKWKIMPVDLSLYMGTNVVVNIVAAHCTAGGHPGYAYIDTRIGPSINVNGIPSQLAISGSTLTSCIPNATISAPVGYAGYQWIGPGLSSTNAVITTSTAGTYTLSMAGTNSCSNVTKVFTLSFQHQSMQINANVALPCPGDSVTLTANGTTSYTWSTGATSSSIVVAPMVTTVYSVSGTAGNCQASGSRTIVVGQVPPLFVTSSQPLLCLGDSALLNVFGTSSFTWSTGSHSPTIIVSPLTSTLYFVTGSNGGCPASTVLTQLVQNCTGIAEHSVAGDTKIYPNPADDYFNVESDSPLEMRVFNQLGSIVFKATLKAGINVLKFDHVSAGVYFAELRVSNETSIVKIVKQ